MKNLVIGTVAATALTLSTAIPAPAVDPLHPACRGLLTANGKLVDETLVVDGDGIPGEERLDMLKVSFDCL
jgi:hypothetical protein